MDWILALLAAGAMAAPSTEPPAREARVVPSTVARSARTPEPLVTAARVRAAREWIATREGGPSFAVIGTGGRLRGYEHTATYPSASVTKAMLLVAVLRDARDRELTGEERRLLEPMILASKNPPARQLFARYGSPALHAVAEAARMQRFESAGTLFDSRICAGDQARFFLRIDRLVPERHRRYARHLLHNVIEPHRWGIPPAARRNGLRAYIKGGWRSDVVHQVALLERSRRERIAIAVLTASTSQNYGRNTVRGVADRLLG